MGGQEPPPNPADNRQNAVFINVCCGTILAIVVTILRMITRIWIVRKVGWDDYTILLAMAGHIVGWVLVLCEIHYGFGLHREFISTSSYTAFVKYSYLEWIQTFQTLMFNKLSICLFLLRLPVKTWLIRPLQASIGILIVSNVILTFVWIFQCVPVQAIWEDSELDTCMTNAQLQRIIISQAIISIISDVVLSLFPIVLLWNVQISQRTKFGLCSLMSLGLITASLCFVRTILNGENVNQDPTWKSIPNWGFRSWEVTIGIVAASIPALRPGYRVVTTYVASYYSLHILSSSANSGETKSRPMATSQRHLKPSDHSKDVLATHGAGDSDSDTKLVGALSQPSQAHTAARAAVHTAHVEADRAAVVGEGDEQLPMTALKGDVGTAESGITKTMWFGTESDREEAFRASRGSEGDLEWGERGRAFV